MTSSSDQISILGSGWLGLPLAKELQQTGYSIKTSTRSRERLEQIHAGGVEACLFDIESDDNELKFLQADILIINITSKNIEAFKALIRRIEASSISKVLFISSTSVYADSSQPNPAPITENNVSALKPCPLLEIENLFTDNSHFETSIIRFAGLIGYQRHPGRFFLQQNENNELSCKPIRNPDGLVNMIHRDDCIGIIQAVIKQKCWGQAFNGCSSQHPTRREFYTWAIADYIDKKSSEKESNNKKSIAMNFPTTDVQSYKIIDNTKVKNQLGFTFKQDDLFANKSGGAQ
jgi:nucleoside-diphosphate-sugar epimerase